MKPIIGMIIGLALLPLVAGCYCFQAEHKDEPQCIVLHQTIDCTESALGTLLPVVASIIGAFIEGQASIDWGFIEQKLEAAGIKDGGCLLAQLENDFVGKAQASPAHAARVKEMQEHFSAWKTKHKLDGVKFCLDKAQKVCR